MEWNGVLATVLGAVVGVGAGLVTEHTRARRERWRERASRRDTLYAEYLARISQVYERLRVLALTTSADDPARRAALAAAFDGPEGAYALRYRLALFATPRVDEAGQAAFRGVRGVRDALLNGDGGWTSDPVAQARAGYWAAFEDLQARMREELAA